jgi:hypothetical protein
MKTLAMVALLLLAKEPRKTKVAVLDLTTVTGQDAPKVKLLGQLVVSEVSNYDRLTVIAYFSPPASSGTGSEASPPTR